MPKSLSATEVASIAKDGEYRVDRNLYLQVRDGGQTRSWLLRYRFRGRLRRMGLGSARLFTLTEIRRKVLTAQKQLADGIDPLAAKWAERAKHAAAADAPTFEQCAMDYIAVAKAGWRDAKRAGQWERSLKNYAFKTIGHMPVSAVTTDDVLHILKPIWTTKSETASKLRGRIENIIDWAVAKKFREPGPNPASWRGPLGKLLPSISKVQRTTHHPSVPYAEIPALFASIRAVGGVTADALGFTLLTAVRSGEARGARWREFNLEAKVWTIPGERTKTGKDHIVPLTDAAIELLNKPDTLMFPGMLVFPGAKRGQPMSDATMLKLMRQLRPDAVVHGLRASFRTWAGEATDYPREVAEAALGHLVGDDVERAYARTTFFDKRRELMDDWSTFATGSGQNPAPGTS